MVGQDTTTHASFVNWIGQSHGSNLLYDTLWAEGCVFYARTAQPQTIMHLETSSVIYGRTVNPHNRDLTPGGSSGGESALLGLRGSILVSKKKRLEICKDTVAHKVMTLRASAGTLAAAFAVRRHMLVFTVSSTFCNRITL